MGPSQPDEPSTPARDARRDLALAWAVGFTMWGLLLSVDPLLPAIQDELALTFTLRSLVLALPFLSMAIAAIPGGLLADRSGIRRSVTLGGAIATGGAALRAIPGGTVLLLTAAVVFGVGLVLVIPNLPKLVSTRYGRDRGLLHGPDHGKRRGRLCHETNGRWLGFLAMGSARLGRPRRVRCRRLDSLGCPGTSVPPSLPHRIPKPRAPKGTLGPRVPLRGGERELLLSRRELSAVPDLAGPRPRCGLGPARALDRGGRSRDLPCPDHVRSPEGPPSIPLGSSR